MSRRSFLATTAKACAGAGAMLTAVSSVKAASDKSKTIRILYSLHAPVQSGPDWPNVGFDFNPVMNRYNALLTQSFPNYKFIPTLATGEEQAEKFLAEDKKENNVDGYIVFQMNCWNRVVQTMVEKSDCPVLYVDFKYAGSGGHLVYTAGYIRQNRANFGFVSSSYDEDIIASVKCFDNYGKGNFQGFSNDIAKVRIKGTPDYHGKCKKDEINFASTKQCLDKLSSSKILALIDDNEKDVSEVMGIPLKYISFSELDQAHKDADKEKAKEIAEMWASQADSVENTVSSEVLNNSAAMYLGMKALLAKHGANAITINCLGGFYGGKLHAYPCLGFMQLDNEGLVGACECDVHSTATKLVINALTNGRPGYISDPVIDTSDRTIIYAHCVGSNRMFGPDNSTNPYSIMTHSEDRQGASVRSKMPLGYMTTTLKFNPENKQIVLHQGRAVANDPDDRACRTKLVVEPVGDFEKLFTEWDRWGWHRVTCYGDLKKPIYELADAMGYKVIEDC